MANAFFSTLGVLLALFVFACLLVLVAAPSMIAEARQEEARRKRRRRKARKPLAEVLRPDPRRFMPPDAK